MIPRMGFVGELGLNWIRGKHFMQGKIGEVDFSIGDVEHD